MNFLELTKKDLLLVILLGILVGLFYIGPPVMIWEHISSSGDEFVLAQFKTTRDSLYTYLPRAREIYDGHFPPSELYADAESPSIRNPLPSAIFAGFIFLFKGDINLAYLAAQFLFAAIIFALFYVLGLLLFSKSRLWSLLFAFLATLTPITLVLPFQHSGLAEFINIILKNFIPLVKTQVDKLYLYDLDNPLLTYPFYLAAIISLFAFWRNSTKTLAVLAALFAGLLFYVYFHFWVYWVIVIGLLFLYVLVAERKSDRLKNFFILWAVLAVMAAPYFVNYFEFINSPAAEDSTARLGLAQGRTLGVNSANVYDFLVYLILAVLVYFAYFRRDRNRAVFFWGLIGAIVIAWNIQLVTGFVPVPHTWLKAASPVIFIILFGLIYELARRLEARRPNIKKPLAAVLILLVVFMGVKKIANIFSLKSGLQGQVTDFYKFDNDIVRSWNWINQNLEAEPKIISPSAVTSLYLTTYTSARPYLATAFITNLPTSELDERYLSAHKLFGVSSAYLGDRLRGVIQKNCSGFDCFPDKGSNLNDSLWHVYGNYFASQEGSYEQFVRGGPNRRLIAQRRKDLEELRVQELVARYPSVKADWRETGADYVYYGPLEKQISDINLRRESNLELVYENSSVEIYKINR